MLKFHEKRKLQRFMYSRYVLGFLVLPVGFMTYVAFNAYQSEHQTRLHRVALEAELAALEQRAVSLGDDITRLEDPYGIEAELRKRYDVGWAGEEAIVLIADEEESEQPEPVVAEPERGWWGTMWARFM